MSRYLNLLEHCMRIAIMGSGGLGGFYGGRLAKQGYDVSFIARGEQLDAIRKSGLRLVGPVESIHLNKLTATNKPEEIGPVDVILFCVKLYDVESAGKLIKPIISEDTIIISVLNGINGPERISKVLDKGLVFGGSARVSARISQPGVVNFLGNNEDHKLTFGYSDSGIPDIAYKFCDACNKSNFPAVLSENIEIELWDKFVQLTHVAGLTTLARKPIGDVLKDPDLFRIGEKILREVETVARAKKIALPLDIFEKKIDLICSFPYGLYASMYHDLVSGKRIEVEDIFGYLSRQGKQFSVQTPVINFIYSFLKPHINGGGQ